MVKMIQAPVRFLRNGDGPQLWQTHFFSGCRKQHSCRNTVCKTKLLRPKPTQFHRRTNELTLLLRWQSYRTHWTAIRSNSPTGTCDLMLQAPGSEKALHGWNCPFPLSLAKTRTRSGWIPAGVFDYDFERSNDSSETISPDLRPITSGFQATLVDRSGPIRLPLR